MAHSYGSTSLWHLCEADRLLELRREAPADVVWRRVGRELAPCFEGARAPHLGARGCRRDWYTAAGSLLQFVGLRPASVAKCYLLTPPPRRGELARRTCGPAAPRSRLESPEMLEILAAKRMMVEAKRSDTNLQ